VARILIVGGGCRGRRLAAAMHAEGHAVRVTTRGQEGCEAIAAAGAECWVGTPARLATLRGALENVTVACWLLGTAQGTAEELRALHGSRLELFLHQAIDTTVRGIVYEAAGSVPAGVLAEGARTVERLTGFNVIPSVVLEADPREPQAWVAAARAAIDGLLARQRT
jgi:NAD(P)-dependent dehydrogenase (short-subunit alcohol dehydrogenase family)